MIKPRAELPLARQHPRRGQRADRQQPQAPGQEPVDRGGQGRAAARVSRASRQRRGALDRRGGAGARSATARACREIAVLYRSNAQSRVLEHALFIARHRLPRLRRPALLRARRRSSTRSPTCAWSRAPTTTARSCASSTSRRAASARARSSSCRTLRASSGISLWRRLNESAGGEGVARHARVSSKLIDEHARGERRGCRCPRWSST